MQETSDEFMIVASIKDKAMATVIAEHLDIPLGDISFGKLGRSETVIDVKSYINNKKVFLIYNIASPVNESIMELLFLAGHLKRKGAEKVYLITSYLPYTKIKYETMYKVDFNLFSRLVEEAGIDAIYTFDLYAGRIVFAFKIPVYNIHIETIFGDFLKSNFKHNENLVVTCLEYEQMKKAQVIANMLNRECIYPMPTGDKKRYDLRENVNEKDVLIVADIIATGKEIIGFANHLAYKGARSIYVIATHGVTLKDTIPLIERSIITEIYTITHIFDKCNKIKVILVNDIIEELIRRIINNKNPYSIVK